METDRGCDACSYLITDRDIDCMCVRTRAVKNGMGASWFGEDGWRHSPGVIYSHAPAFYNAEPRVCFTRRSDDSED